jgi:hypothetical protein
LDVMLVLIPRAATSSRDLAVLDVRPILADAEVDQAGRHRVAHAAHVGAREAVRVMSGR